MPRTRRQFRRQSDFEDALEADTAAPASPSSAPLAQSATPSFSVNDLSSIIATLQQTQTAAFERLLDRVLSHESRRESPPPTPAAAPSPAMAYAPAHHLGTFAMCTARFSGAPGGDSLDGFIDAVEAYKECACVGDENALRGLSMLVTGDAAVWWQGIKSTITSWSEAVTSLRSSFGDRRPPHRIYMELFSMSQGPSEKTELFVAKARALLARLPPGDVTEKVQLDMLYGLLHRRVRERLRRDEVTSFDTLLRKARHVEDATDESADGFQHRHRVSVSSSPPPTAGEVPATVSTLPQHMFVAPTTPRATRGLLASSASGRPHSNNAAAPAHPSWRDLPATDTAGYASPPRSRYCVYCKNYGHLRDECIKLKSKDNTDPQAVPTCYNCNAKGVTRSQCAKCNADYYAVDVAWSIPASDRSITGEVKPQDLARELKNENKKISKDEPASSGDSGDESGSEPESPSEKLMQLHKQEWANHEANEAIKREAHQEPHASTSTTQEADSSKSSQPGLAKILPKIEMPGGAMLYPGVLGLDGIGSNMGLGSLAMSYPHSFILGLANQGQDGASSSNQPQFITIPLSMANMAMASANGCSSDDSSELQDLSTGRK